METEECIARECGGRGTRNTVNELVKIAKWTEEKFNLSILPSRFTISRIINITANIEEKARYIRKHREKTNG